LHQTAPKLHQKSGTKVALNGNEMAAEISRFTGKVRLKLL